jgi:CRISPR-associated protein Cas2
MFIVVTYDIPDNKRRTRLHKALFRFGEPAQFSVFECIITEAQFDALRREVANVMEPTEDSVRYYQVCDGCRRRLIALGQAQTTSIPPAYIL